ncbi:hypothetical protein [Hydrogenophaga sp. ANAO-22]|uniref:hypothetical protein n=1 Tax=Hydrogenophaga sp. ANAO-22 TaxID=3166645 RepID=UPI0036D2BE6B
MRIPSSLAQDIRNGALIGAAVLTLLMPPAKLVQGPDGPQAGAAIAVPLAPLSAPEPDFGGVEATANAHELVQWIARTGDNAGMPFVLVDKPAARLHVFNANASLRDSTPVLLGFAPGDDTVPGIGNRPVEQVKPHERTTPAGRFVGHLGHNLTGEDVVWVDYDAAVSMHRVRPTLQPKERRAERLASATIDDNRISYGCINVPAAFYEAQLKPVFSTMSAVVYVLPEHKSLSEVFGLTTAPAPSPQEARVRRSAGSV